MTTMYADAPADAAELATGAVDLGWQVSVINPDPETYSLRFCWGNVYDDGLTVIAAWFGTDFVVGVSSRGDTHRPQTLASLDDVKRCIEDQARS